MGSSGSAVKVVTGASGYIGGVLAHALATRYGSRSVRATYRDRRGSAAAIDVECVKCDVLDKGSLIAAFAGADAVFHLAALVSIDPGQARQMQTINGSGTRNVVEAALGCGVRRLIHFSSIHAYNQHPIDEVLDETQDLVRGPRYDAYDRSKAAGEREVRRGIDRGLDAVILNPTGTIGPFDGRPSHMGQFLIEYHRRRIPAMVAGGFDWVDVRDVVAAALAAAERGRCGENYILSGGWQSNRQLARICEQVTGVPSPRLVLPMLPARLWAPFQVAWDRCRGRRPLYTPATLRSVSECNRQISSAKARAELGFRARPVVESVRDAYHWFEEQGMLGEEG